MHHRIYGLTHRLLVDLFQIDFQAVNGVDRQLPLGYQLALAQRFIGVAFARGRGPGQVALALFVALLVQVLDGFEGDAAATVQGQVVAALQLGALVQLVASADQRQVASGVDLAADVLDVGDFVTPGFLAAPTALLLLVVQRVVAVLCGEQLQVAASDQVGFLTGSDVAGDQRQVLAGAKGDVAAGIEVGADLADVVFLGLDFFGFAVAVLLVRSRSQGEVIAGVQGKVALSVQLADARCPSGSGTCLRRSSGRRKSAGRCGRPRLAESVAVRKSRRPDAWRCRRGCSRGCSAGNPNS